MHRLTLSLVAAVLSLPWRAATLSPRTTCNTDEQMAVVESTLPV